MRRTKITTTERLVETLDIDTATYCKIERGERKAKREQLFVIAELLKADKDELLSLWLADQVAEAVANKNVAIEVVKMVKREVKYKIKQKYL
jgi:transcriptional regulator with XRE-family HTH domain